MSRLLGFVLCLIFLSYSGKFIEALKCDTSNEHCSCQDFRGYLNIICHKTSEILTDLKTFGNITNNPIKIINVQTEMKTLPEAYFKGLKVWGLSLSGSQFKFQNESLAGLEPYLKEFSIAGTKTDVLPNLVKFTKLKELSFDIIHRLFNSSLDKWVMDHFPSENLYEIRFVHCHLKSISEGVFEKFTALKIVDLEGNELTSLPENLFPPGVEKINLRSNKFFSAPTKTLLKLYNLKEVILEYNEFTDLLEDEFLPLLRNKFTLDMKKKFTLDMAFNRKIQCSCDMQWISKLDEEMKRIIKGQCFTKGTRQMRNIYSLKNKDFNDCTQENSTRIN